MGKAHLFHVDAFTDQAFHGGPAPVIVVDRPVDAVRACALTVELKQPVAVFLRRIADGCEARFFEPSGEVGLVGHAGLAAGYIALNKLFLERDAILLNSPIGGPLPVERDGGAIALDFAAMHADTVVEVPGLQETLGPVAIVERLTTDFGSVAVIAEEDAVHNLTPDLCAALQVPGETVIVTAPGREVDFVSRVFAPKVNLPEDPVCGTAQRILAPYWAARLGRTQLSAHQLSARGGQFQCEIRGDRIRLSGLAIVLFEGELSLSFV